MALGIAAGAFAQNYANALGLKSRLASERQQQELTGIKLEAEKEFRQLQTDMGNLYKNFNDNNFDFANNKPYEVQQGGIATPEQAQRPRDPYMDPTRVKAYYDRLAPMLERQAVLGGKDPFTVRRELNNLRKEQFVERVGSALSMIEAGDDAGIKNLQAVYDLYPDGRKITGGKINEDGSVLLQYEQDGKPGERVVSRQQLLEMGKLALNPADAVKLRVQLIEKQKDRDLETNLTDKKITASAAEGSANRENARKMNDADNKTRRDEGEATRRHQASEGAADRRNRADISASDNKTRETVAGLSAKNDVDAAAQKFFRERFSVPQFTPKPESEVKNLFGEQKKAYERDLASFTERETLSRTATNIFAANPGMSKPKIAQIAEGLKNKKFEVFQEDSSGRRFVNEGGKRIYLD